MRKNSPVSIKHQKPGTQKKIGSFFLLHGVQVYKSKKLQKQCSNTLTDDVVINLPLCLCTQQNPVTSAGRTSVDIGASAKLELVDKFCAECGWRR